MYIASECSRNSAAYIKLRFNHSIVITICKLISAFLRNDDKNK